ncbi:GspE/PulE family protein [Pseudomonas syringae]|uniref:GspE/PulE family protein n=1 Tax=Pseudomonas syringae TaxID=317 RepID=UPI0002FBDE69|nr:GspE/PulE family protein [Pseudomonas syringae]
MSGLREPDQFIWLGQQDKLAAEFLNSLFKEAAEINSSDIHFHRFGNKTDIKFRIGEDLELFHSVDAAMSKHIDEKIRARCNMSDAERHIPLDGRMRFVFGESTIDVRVNLVPSYDGQSVVCRLLDQANATKTLSDIQMPSIVRTCFQSLLHEPQGIILVTGPTGSGKTTSLYGALNELNNGTLKIIALEDPTEYVVPSFVQIQVSQKLSFADGLRAILRQDPDVILVGEIRDLETANIAIQAAKTGHIVLATIHTNDAASTPSRLLDMGVDPHDLAACLLGIVAQRLVPTIAESTEISWQPPSEVERLWLKKNGLNGVTGNLPHVATPKGFRGKMPIIELIKSDKAVRAAIISGKGTGEVLNAAAKQPQFETLAQASLRLILDGVTTLEKVRRVVKDESMVPAFKRLGEVMVSRGMITLDDVQKAVEEQNNLLAEGKIVRIGQLLIRQGHVALSDVISASGFTAGAEDTILALVDSGDLPRNDVLPVIESWKRERQDHSLYEILSESNVIDKETLHEKISKCIDHSYDVDAAAFCSS